MKKYILLMAMCMSAAFSIAQWETFGNTTLDETNSYIGNNDNISLNFRTDSIQRMKLYPSQSSVINGFTLQPVNQNGYLGISQQPLFFTNTVGPFSRLHLVDSASNNATVYAQQIGFRPWQRNGITMTGNSDQCYIGQKYNNNQNDNSDLVLQWSDNPANSSWGTDRLRFLFTSWSQGANRSPSWVAKRL